MKGLKTTVIAVICISLGVALFVLWFLKKMDDSQLTMGLAAIGTFGTTIGLMFAKDADKSHSEKTNRSSLTGGHPDPKKEEK